MPVGTAATVKAMLPQSVAATAPASSGQHLSPHAAAGGGARRGAGGLHRFMNWAASDLTDSGGYQVMSLAGLREISESGVEFRSHLDGSRHVLSPERLIEIQHLLDADMTMALDECTPLPGDGGGRRRPRSISRCAGRSARAAPSGRRPGYGIFGIVQGGS